MAKKEEEHNPPIPGLITGNDIPKQLRVRRSPYDFLTISRKKKSEYEEQGWELAKKNSKSFRMRRPKPHDAALADRTWSMLGKLGWTWMNQDHDFCIRYLKDDAIPGKQFDVFASDSETVILVACESSEQQRRKSFQKHIEEITNIRRGIIKTVGQKFGGKPKIAWIILTKNILVSESDSDLFQKNNILHFTENDLEYYEKLAEHLGPVAKYQLFGRLFKNQNIPNLDTRVPAIKGKAGGYEIYSFLVEPELILKIGYVLHRSESTGQALETYQRLVKKSRIKSIEKYINEGGFFPNSIIINIHTKKKPEFKLAGGGEHASNASLGVLHLPSKYQSALIIDGQHRLFGYGQTESRLTNMIPVVAFCNLPADKQGDVFVTINHEQRSVPTNLLMTLMSEFHWDSDDPGEALSSAMAKLVEKMNGTTDSLLYRRIVLGEESRSDVRSITLRYLIGQGIKRTSFLGRFEKGGTFHKGHLSDRTWKATVNKTYKFLNACFVTIADKAQDQWDKGQASGGFITMNLGLSALVRVIDDIIEYLVAEEGLVPTKYSADELHAEVVPYLNSVSTYLAGLNAESISVFRSWGGGSATQRAVREFQKVINADYNSFTPDGFLQWKKESTGEFNDKLRPVAEKLQIRINRHVISVLKKEFGEKNWWKEIPEGIQKSCSNRMIEDKYAEPEENYLNLIDYKDIIRRHSKLLLKIFTPPDMDSAKQDKKLTWLANFSKIRNKLVHPEREKVTEEEYHSVMEIEKWLFSQVPENGDDIQMF